MRMDQDRLIAALAQLPLVPRIVYLLSATDGMTHAEIAFRLNCSEKEVEANLAQALALLAAGLDDPWRGEFPTDRAASACLMWRYLAPMIAAIFP